MGGGGGEEGGKTPTREGDVRIGGCYVVEGCRRPWLSLDKMVEPLNPNPNPDRLGNFSEYSKMVGVRRS